jgi:hypothetical protein
MQFLQLGFRIFFAFVVICTRSAPAQAHGADSSALVQSRDVKQFGYTVRYPSSWSVTQQDGIV